MKRNQPGFSLIELLITVAIIWIMSAIALRNLMVAGGSASEASSVQSLCTIQSAETAYATSFPAVRFSATLADLGALASGYKYQRRSNRSRRGALTLWENSSGFFDKSK